MSSPGHGEADAALATLRSERLRLDVLLDQSLFEVDRYMIHKTKPVAVIMNGEIVHGELSEMP